MYYKVWTVGNGGRLGNKRFIWVPPFWEFELIEDEKKRDEAFGDHFDQVICHRCLLQYAGFVGSQ